MEAVAFPGETGLLVTVKPVFPTLIFRTGSLGFSMTFYYDFTIGSSYQRYQY